MSSNSKNTSISYYLLSNHVIFSFLINFVLISVSVQHEKSAQQKKGFPSCHELTTKKKVLSPQKLNLRPTLSVFRGSAESESGVIRRK